MDVSATTAEVPRGIAATRFKGKTLGFTTLASWSKLTGVKRSTTSIVATPVLAALLLLLGSGALLRAEEKPQLVTAEVLGVG
jgi:hypothetical protein